MKKNPFNWAAIALAFSILVASFVVLPVSGNTTSSADAVMAMTMTTTPTAMASAGVALDPDGGTCELDHGCNLDNCSWGGGSCRQLCGGCCYKGVWDCSSGAGGMCYYAHCDWCC